MNDNPRATCFPVSGIKLKVDEELYAVDPDDVLLNLVPKGRKVRVFASSNAVSNPRCGYVEHLMGSIVLQTDCELCRQCSKLRFFHFVCNRGVLVC